MRSMESVLQAQNNLSMLNKALDAGQITVIEYITEIGVLYQSRQMQLQLERDYNLITAQLFPVRIVGTRSYNSNFIFRITRFRFCP